LLRLLLQFAKTLTISFNERMTCNQTIVKGQSERGGGGGREDNGNAVKADWLADANHDGKTVLRQLLMLQG